VRLEPAEGQRQDRRCAAEDEQQLLLQQRRVTAVVTAEEEEWQEADATLRIRGEVRRVREEVPQEERRLAATATVMSLRS